MMPSSAVEIARPLLFVRAMARAVTSHERIGEEHARWTRLARMMGELVSLLALAFLAEHKGADRPYAVLMGIFFAFFLPNLVLHESALRSARKSVEKVVPGWAGHVGVSVAGVGLCMAAYEAMVHLTDVADAFVRK